MRWTSCSKEKSTPLIGSPTECCNYGSTLPFLSEGSLSVISSESTVTPTSQPPPFQAFLNRPLLMAFLNYGFLAFTDMSHAALLPLMYSTSIPLGGLGLDPFRIGTALGAFGFFNAFVQINFLGRLIRHFGPRGVYMVAYASFLICIGSYPIMSYFAKRAGKVDGIVAAIMTIQLTFQITISMAYGMSHRRHSLSNISLQGTGSIQIMFVEYAPGKAALGSTNGIGQMIASGMRSFAPTIASSLFSVSLQHKLVGGYMVYYILLGIIIVGMRLSVLLPTRPQTP
jgi:MFS family permease